VTALRGKIAVVTGASRGVGRGIAHELGLAGATVYVTGRSVDGEPTTDGTPGTIQETARLVTESGGQGIPVRCDHGVDAEVGALATLIRAEHGRLDLLVNNVWGGYENYEAQVWTLPMWQQPVARWDKMMTTGVRAHYTTSRALIPLMPRQDAALIVHISSGDRGRFLGDVQYDVAKVAIDRLAFATGEVLSREGIAVITVHPGFCLTERVQRFAPPEHLASGHSPRFVGRAVVALATDPAVMVRTRGSYKVGQLGLDYGFLDVDGSQPKPWSMEDGG